MKEYSYLNNRDKPMFRERYAHIFIYIYIWLWMQVCIIKMGIVSFSEPHTLPQHNRKWGHNLSYHKKKYLLKGKSNN